MSALFSVCILGSVGTHIQQTGCATAKCTAAGFWLCCVSMNVLCLQAACPSSALYGLYAYCHCCHCWCLCLAHSSGCMHQMMSACSYKSLFALMYCISVKEWCGYGGVISNRVLALNESLWPPCLYDGGAAMALFCGQTNFSDLLSFRSWNTCFKWVI